MRARPIMARRRSAPPEPRERRLFSDAYDSVHQRGERDRLGSVRDLRLVSLARLRLDVILSGRVVLTDAQVLDGPAFGAWKPLELARLLDITGTARLPIEVRCREAGLAASLAGLVLRADGTLKPFEFSSLGERQRRAASALLADPPARLARAVARGAASDPIGAVTRVLEEAEVGERERQRLTRSWSRWCEAAESGAVAVVEWDSSRYDLRNGLALAGRSQAHDEELELLLESGEARSTFHHIEDVVAAQPRSTSRTVVRQIVGDEVRDPDDAALLLEWIDRVYGLTLREQHGAEDYSADTPIYLQRAGFARFGAPRLAAQYDSERLLATIEDRGLCGIGLPSDFLLRLAVVDITDLQDWWRGCRTDMAAWRDVRRGGRRALRQSLAGLESLLLERVRERDLVRAMGAQDQLPRQDFRPVGSTAGYELIEQVVGEGAIRGTGVVWFVSNVAAKLSLGRLFSNPSILTTDVALPRRVRA
jgi:hypothetical protein